MPLTEELRDTFNDNTVDTVKWPSNYNTGAGGLPTEAGGRARVACDTGFSAYTSDNTYTLATSHAWVEMYPPAAGGATTEAWAQLLITSSTSGTDVIFEVNTVTNLLTMAVRTGFFDPGAATLTYDATAHRWLRIGEAAGTLVWSTSPDGLTWTERRTTTAPAWVADTDLEIQLITHRDSGTPDVAEFDNFNVTPSTAAFADLTDTFDAPTVDTTKWPDNYNTGPGGTPPDQTGGQARVPCDEGFAAFASAPIYRLQDSHARVQVIPPEGPGHSESYAQLLILSDVPGTQIVFEIDAATNVLLMAVYEDFVDENAATLPYDPTTHAWLGVREDTGTLLWETSPDGREWTSQHTTTAPAWTSENDLQVQLLAHCTPLVTGGPPSSDYAYFDQFNIRPTLPERYTVAIDWAGDGTFDDPYDDVTSDVLARGAVTFSYGRDQARQLAPPRVGTASMTLCNADRIYSPENPDSPIADDMSPAAPVKVDTVLNDTLYPLFMGRVDEVEIHPDRGDRSIDITAVDLLSLLQGAKISTELFQAERTGVLVHAILDAIGWTGPRDIDLGATHVPWWWLEDTDAFAALADLLASEGAPSIAYVSPDGTFIYRDRHHRLLRAASLTSQAVFAAVRPACLTTTVIDGPPQQLQVSDEEGVLATLTVGAKTVTMRGPTRTFTEQKRPFTDLFDRTTSNGWGPSPGGGTWSNANGVDANYSVAAGTGRINITATNSSRHTSLIDNLTDCDARLSWSLDVQPAGNASSLALSFAYTSSTSQYRARLSVLSTGTVQLTLEKQTPSATTTLGALTTVGTGYTVGDIWHIRAQRQGTTLRCRAWKDGDEEPTTWLHEVTDDELGAGRVGVRGFATTGSTAVPFTFHIYDLQLYSGRWPVTPTVTHNTWVRVLDEPFTGVWTDALAEQILQWSNDSSPDVLAWATRYITGAPPVTDPSLGVQVAGQSGYGPLDTDGTRIEGADFHDYMGLDWVFPNGETQTANPDEALCMDCSGFVRMIYGFHMGIPMVRNLNIDGTNLPRQTMNIGPDGPGVIVAQGVGTPPSLAGMQIGDVPHFDATSDGETEGQIDHNGIYLGVDQNGNMRFINSRKTPNGPTFGDLGGASVLNGSGTYTTSLRIIRRF